MELFRFDRHDVKLLMNVLSPDLDDDNLQRIKNIIIAMMNDNFGMELEYIMIGNKQNICTKSEIFLVVNDGDEMHKTYGTYEIVIKCDGDDDTIGTVLKVDKMIYNTEEEHKKIMLLSDFKCFPIDLDDTYIISVVDDTTVIITNKITNEEKYITKFIKLYESTCGKYEGKISNESFIDNHTALRLPFYDHDQYYAILIESRYQEHSVLSYVDVVNGIMYNGSTMDTDVYDDYFVFKMSDEHEIVKYIQADKTTLYKNIEYVPMFKENDFDKYHFEWNIVVFENNNSVPMTVCENYKILNDFISSNTFKLDV